MDIRDQIFALTIASCILRASEGSHTRKLAPRELDIVISQLMCDSSLRLDDDAFFVIQY